MTSPGLGSTGRRLGRYHLAEPLGGGPTGEVFRAKVYGVAGFEREFAVKRLHPEFVSDPEVAATIATAARTYGSLEHPRIARLHEYGVAGGNTFTATELIPGLDAARLISMTHASGQPLPMVAAVALVSQAARAVGYAHGRGVCHLGLCPTNVVITPEGDVKITDFCFLPTRLPDRPGEDYSLHARMPYLAPEQLVGEPTSAATDVYQLGVVAYELLTGQPPFSGPTSPDVSHRILSADVPTPDLPAPLISVLQRCLTRSPFERYPDARALADALDAALREASLPEGQRELSTIMRELMAQVAAVSGNQNSGAVSFPLPAPPSPRARPAAPRSGQAGAKTQSRQERDTTTVRMTQLDPSTAMLPEISPAVPQARRRPGTAAGKASRGLRGRASQPAMPPITLKDKLSQGGQTSDLDDEAATAVELGYLDEEAPTNIRERDIGFVKTGQHPTVSEPDILNTGQHPTVNEPASQPPAGRPSTAPPRRPSTGMPTNPGDMPPTRPGTAQPTRPGTAQPTRPSTAQPMRPGTAQPTRPSTAQPMRPGTAPVPADQPTATPGATMPLHVQALQPPARPSAPAGGPPPAVPTGGPAKAAPPPVPPAQPPRPATADADGNVGGDFGILETLAPDIQAQLGAMAPESPMESPGEQPASSPSAQQRPAGGRQEHMPLPSPPDSGAVTIPPAVLADLMSDIEPRQTAELGKSRSAQRRRLWSWVASMVVVVCGLGASGYMIYDGFLRPQASPDASTARDTSSPGEPPAPAGATTREANAPPPTETARPGNEDGEAAAAGQAAETGEPSDAAGATAQGAEQDESPPLMDKLVIRSTPRRAKVYLDGSPQGKTPLTLDATADSHRLAVILPGYKLHTSDIDGSGKLDIALEEVTPPGGPAGIKIRCRKKNRYYVIVDGHDTGQLCPTERIGVDLGEHTIEIYDPINDSRQEFHANVKDTHHSVRIRVD